MRNVSVYLDVAPLFEHHWTGIPVVTSIIARMGVLSKDRSWRFLYNNQVISRDIVVELLRSRSGQAVERHLLDILSGSPLPGYADMRSSAAIFPNVKPVQGLFYREAMILHDFSTILTPEFHNDDTINHHANRFRRDIDTTDMFFCVSKATADDLENYFNVSKSSISVTPNGVSWPVATVLQAATMLRRRRIRPFAIVVGTIEPRKNALIVLEYIIKNTDILDKMSFVFVGRDGWLNERGRLETFIREERQGKGRIVFTGFISEALKLALLCAASFSIYPSLFEGFGLPVLESLSAGCPVLCSNSSSLPEVAKGNSVLFDPTSPDSFARAFAKIQMESRSRSRRREIDVVACIDESKLGWHDLEEGITMWLNLVDRNEA